MTEPPEPRSASGEDTRILDLARIPSPKNWMALGMALRSASREQHADPGQYLPQALSHWPDRLRRIRFSPAPLSDGAVWQIDRRSAPVPYSALSRTLELSVSDAYFLDPTGPAIRAISDAITAVELFGSIRISDRDTVKVLVRCLRALEKCTMLDLTNFVLHDGAGGISEGYGPFWEAFLKRLPKGRFTDIRFDETPLGPAGIEILGISGLAGSIRYLGLSGCQLGPRGARALTQWDGALALEQLNLAANQITTRAARSLLRGPLAVGLSALSLASNPISEPFVDGIRFNRGQLKLRSLDLSGTSLGSITFMALVNGELTSKLVDLRMARCSVGDEVATCLLDGEFRSRVEILDLSGTSITDVFARTVTAQRPPPRLKVMSLMGTSISNTAMSSLRAWAGTSDPLRLSFDGPAPPMMTPEDGT